MGRKIPGKKHRGVKDPYAQHAKRLASIKAHINKTPQDLDDQPVPKSVKRLMSWKNDKTADKKNDRKSKPHGFTKITKKSDPSNNKHNNPVNKLKKISGESNKSFNMRINEAMKSLKYEQGFDDIENDMPTERKDNRGKDEDGNSIFIQKKGKKRRINTEEPFLTKSQKRTLKEKLKKQKKKEEKELDQKYIVQKDSFKFGETVHEPPSLNVKPRKADKPTTVARPARKDLLLNQLFDKNVQASKNVTKSPRPNITVNQKKTDGVVDLKGKRKDLPQNVRRKIEQSQKEAIEAYKLLKLEKMKQSRES